MLRLLAPLFVIYGAAGAVIFAAAPVVALWIGQ
jgi:hypothetical protein